MSINARNWLLAIFLYCFGSPAWAHVKWFLGKSQDEILKQPKPELFTQLSLANLLPIGFAWIALLTTVGLSRRFVNWPFNHKLFRFAEEHEAAINLFIACCFSFQLIHCSMTSTLFAPNFIICEHCPLWVLPLEMLAGFGLLWGLCTRLSAGIVLFLLGFTFVKHTVNDCLDLIPFYGLAIYFICAGRNRYSLDFYFNRKTLPRKSMLSSAHLFLRLFAGLGFMFLGFEEKLLHPQLALELLRTYPYLNSFSQFGMGNELFVLCAGLTEVLIGAMIFLGALPRLAVFLVAGFFLLTTCLFGPAELFGHAPYYGLIAAIFLRGSGNTHSAMVLHAAFARILRFRSKAWGLATSYWVNSGWVNSSRIKALSKVSVKEENVKKDR
ncbi:MAG: DoxX family membrane protein [Candidatus Obscuribacterales bacterium]|nr:DoxX family membrane protein [Candidatus Obscuribacterales bacterium]